MCDFGAQVLYDSYHRHKLFGVINDLSVNYHSKYTDVKFGVWIFVLKCEHFPFGEDISDRRY